MRLVQPGSGREIRVADERADIWRARGYRDVDSSAATVDDSHVCDECGFEAKTAAGLASHQRSHED